MARRKKQSRKYIPLDEFRFAKSKIYGNHPQYVFGKTRSGKFKTLGLTHTPNPKHKTLPLQKNPNKKDFRPAYISVKPHTIGENYLEQTPQKDWGFVKIDRAVVRHIIKRYKKSYNRKPPNWYVDKKKKR